MFFVIVFMIGIVSCVVNKSWFAVGAFTLLALAALSVTGFSVAPFELGVGRVSGVAEEFTRRLEPGKKYTVVGRDTVVARDPSGGVEGEWILLIREERIGSSRYYAIRVKVSVPIPEHFTLIDGQPVEVK